MLEEKLVAIDSGIDDASERTREIATILRALRKSSGVGNLAQVHRQMTDLNLRVDRLREISHEFQTVLAFDEENYLGSEAFLQELTKAAAAIGVQIVEGHDCLYIYPTSLRVNPQKRCLVVGRRRDARIRPTFVAQELKRLQDDSGRISESAFLEILFQAYLLLARGAASGADGSVIKLSEIYGVLTLLPQVSKEPGLHAGDPLHGLPACRSEALLRQQRDSSAQRVLAGHARAGIADAGFSNWP